MHHHPHDHHLSMVLISIMCTTSIPSSPPWSSEPRSSSAYRWSMAGSWQLANIAVNIMIIHYYHHQCNGHHHHHHHHKGHRHPLSTSLDGDYYMQLLRTLYFIPYKHMMSYHLQVGYDSSRNDSFLEGWLTEHAFITIENLSHCMQSLLQTHLGFYMIWAYRAANPPPRQAHLTSY